MDYLFYVYTVLPCLIGGLYLSISDIHSRRIPRFVVLMSLALQMVWLCVLIYQAHHTIQILIDFFWLITINTALQWILFRVSRGSLSSGDVTSIAVISALLTPLHGRLLLSCAFWWLCTGIYAGFELLYYTYIRKEQTIPFVPAMYLGALTVMSAFIVM